MRNDSNVGTQGKTPLRQKFKVPVHLNVGRLPGLDRFAGLNRLTGRRTAIIALAAAAAGGAAVSGGPAMATPTVATAAGVVDSRSVVPSVATRGQDAAAQSDAAAPDASGPASTAAGAAQSGTQAGNTAGKTAGKPAATKPTKPAKAKPVAGLTQAQMDNAAVIVATGQKQKLPKDAYVIAVATAMQESRLRNLANPSHPQSLDVPNQGVGYDFDSVGLFQQRPASGWGSPSQIMDRTYASQKFYKALVQVPGWQDMSLSEAAQSVQGSAFPDAYAQHQDAAQQVVDALTK
jgi:hypothetical protein